MEMSREEFDRKFEEDKKGIYRRKSDNEIPPDHLLEELGFSMEVREKHEEARLRDLERFADEYNPGNEAGGSLPSIGRNNDSIRVGGRKVTV